MAAQSKAWRRCARGEAHFFGGKAVRPCQGGQFLSQFSTHSGADCATRHFGPANRAAGRPRVSAKSSIVITTSGLERLKSATRRHQPAPPNKNMNFPI